MARHFPDLHRTLENEAPELRYPAFLKAVMEKQIELICHWMRVGFIHGVMNTDNTTISGETIDFGPCAMLGNYALDTVFSSIDRDGRYAFGNQPEIALWNLTRLAECLIPLINDNSPDEAISVLEPVLKNFRPLYSEHFRTMMRSKIGIDRESERADTLVNQLLAQMESQKLDYTRSFNQLSDALDTKSNQGPLPHFAQFFEEWLALLNDLSISKEKAKTKMEKVNPFIIPRNHLIEKAITQSVETGETEYAKTLLNALRTPYERNEKNKKFDEVAEDGDRNYVTYCGT
jgi:uncharacterized protein YdiU (UPF0061 family)